MMSLYHAISFSGFPLSRLGRRGANSLPGLVRERSGVKLAASQTAVTGGRLSVVRSRVTILPLRVAAFPASTNSRERDGCSSVDGAAANHGLTTNMLISQIRPVEEKPSNPPVGSEPEYEWVY